MKNVIFYRILTVITGLLLLAATIFVIVSWQNIPDTVPVHFNFAGEADGYGGKGALMGMMAAAWVMYIAITVLVKFPNTWNLPVKVTAENKARLYSIARGMLEIVKTLTTLMFILMFVNIAIAASLPPWIMTALVAAMLVSIIIGIWLMFKNR